jgi:hypothetical protein
MENLNQLFEEVLNESMCPCAGEKLQYILVDKILKDTGKFTNGELFNLHHLFYAEISKFLEY